MAFASSSLSLNHSDERKIYEYERSPFASVSMTALNYQATDRILSLSKPKIRRDSTIRDGYSRYESNPKYSGVTTAAVKATCSPRVTELAKSVKRYASYQYELPVPRPVPSGALKYQASTRLTELAEPKKVGRA